MVIGTTRSGWQSFKIGHGNCLMSFFGASLTTLSGGGWRLHFRSRGEVAEWFKAAVLKTVEAERLPGVRIPSSPPASARLRRASARPAYGWPSLSVIIGEGCRAKARAPCGGDNVRQHAFYP